MTNSDLTLHDQKPAKWGPRGSAAVTFGAAMAFENISHSYPNIEAVRDVSFELHPGEIICLLGPSGCGKTTLLRIAAGVERPRQGRVLLDDKLVAGDGVFIPPEQRNVGLMFQDYALFPHLTIIDNIAFGLKSLKRRQALDEARLALKRVGLSAYEHVYPGVLSGGEQQRVALARALVPRPAVMLMDEPFSGLDQRLRDNVRHETLALLKETRASAILVTHDPVEAMGLADRILLMRDGRLIQSGPPEQLYHHPIDSESARFFSDFNEFEGVVNERNEINTVIGPLAVTGFKPGQSVLLMVRPQDMKLQDSEIKSVPKGRVARAVFLGDRVELSLQYQGFEGEIIARISPSNAPKPGSLCGLGVKAEQILAFAISSS